MKRKYIKRRFLVIEPRSGDGNREQIKRQRLAKKFGPIRSRSEVESYLDVIGKPEKISVPKGTFFVEIAARANALEIHKRIFG